MLYFIVKYWIRSALFFFFSKIIFNDKKQLQLQGPLLLACNHPNSFLDALLLGAYFRKPVHFLARGDAFKNPIFNRILTALKAIPIYRLREGKEYLALNDATFERCVELLQAGEIVLIFSEGLCENTWALRPLKKGTARIAIAAINKGVDNLRVLPVSFNYSSFTRFRKSVIIHFGKTFSVQQSGANEAEQINKFNAHLAKQLQQGMVDDLRNDTLMSFILANPPVAKCPSIIDKIKQRQQLIVMPIGSWVHNLWQPGNIGSNTLMVAAYFFVAVLLVVPAAAGLLLHSPLYFLMQQVIKHKTKGTVFYHSALFVALAFCYPLYVLICMLVYVSLVGNTYVYLLPVLLPLLALALLGFLSLCSGIANHFIVPKTVKDIVRQ